MTVTSFTTASGMGPLPRLVEDAKGARAVERVFRAEGLPLWLAHDQSSKIPLRSMMGLMERAAREMGDELFGLHLGLACPEDYGPFVRYMVSAPDLLTMIRRSIRSLRYHISGCEFDLEIFDGAISAPTGLHCRSRSSTTGPGAGADWRRTSACLWCSDPTPTPSSSPPPCSAAARCTKFRRRMSSRGANFATW